MERVFKVLSRIFVAVLLVSTAFLPAQAFAADNPNSEGMKAFRQALESDSDAIDRVFRQDILFTSPFVQAELDLIGAVDNNVFKAKGDFSLWLYADDGSVSETIVPYYAVQDGSNMTIYFKDDKEWKKFTAPTLAALVTDMVATPTAEDIEGIIADTKDVSILQENDYRRIMLVTIDGDKIAESFNTLAEANPDGKPEDNTQEDAVKYVESAMRNANIWYMWTIDKRDWHTVAMQYHLSGLVQEMARAALNDPTKNWPDEVSNLLETIAYYSEIRAYTTYPADPKAKKELEIPKNVLKAKSVDSLISNDKKGSKTK